MISDHSSKISAKKKHIYFAIFFIIHLLIIIYCTEIFFLNIFLGWLCVALVILLLFRRIWYQILIVVFLIFLCMVFISMRQATEDLTREKKVIALSISRVELS